VRYSLRGMKFSVYIVAITHTHTHTHTHTLSLSLSLSSLFQDCLIRFYNRYIFTSLYQVIPEIAERVKKTISVYSPVSEELQ